MVAFPGDVLKLIQGSCLAVGLLGAAGPASAATERVVYSFKAGNDGSDPRAGLINLGNTLYGTTYQGGSQSGGTVFQVNRSTGAEKVIHAFTYIGGFGPLAGLTYMGGAFYGTTGQGGSNTTAFGSVFKVTPAGTETTVYTFQSGVDGHNPGAGLTSFDGTTLYGVTSMGGTSSNEIGTVFEVTPAGAETVVYSFKGAVARDGARPNAGLFHAGGTQTFYGTTGGGGAGYGTVYRVTIAGVEKVLHVFKGGSDGNAPAGGLNYANGALYGTTFYGGGGTNCGGTIGCGTVFKVDLDTGAETVIFAFRGGLDGAYPAGGLINVGGMLYGTTSGTGRPHSSDPCGKVFRVNPATGAEAVIYSFLGRSAGDGCSPAADLINVDGTLYGTTSSGGISNAGTVFAVTP